MVGHSTRIWAAVDEVGIVCQSGLHEDTYTQQGVLIA